MDTDGSGSISTDELIASEQFCSQDLPNRYHFDPIAGNDTTGAGSLDNPFRSFQKATSVCAAPGTVCTCRGAFSELRFPLASPSGVFQVGETVNYTGGSALLLDYDPVRAVGIFEDNLTPQHFYATSATGTFTLTHHLNTTAPIDAATVSPSSLTTALEALDSITDVVVVGACSSGSPCQIFFLDPPRPLSQITIDDSGITGGSVTLPSPRLVGSTAITGATSGATANTGTVEDVLGTSALAFSNANCTQGTLCNLFVAEDPNKPCTISGNTRTTPTTLFSASGVQVEAGVSGVILRRLGGKAFAPAAGAILVAHDWEGVEMIATGNGQYLVPGAGGRMISIDGGGTAVFRASTDNAGDLISSLGTGSQVIAVGRRPFRLAPGSNNTGPLLAVGGLGSMQIIGHPIDAARARTGIAGEVVEIGNGSSATTFQLYDVTIRGNDDPAHAAIHFEGTGDVALTARGLTIAQIGRPFEWDSGGSTVNGDMASVLIDDLPAGSLYFDDTSTGDAGITNSTWAMTDWIHNDDAQLADWSYDGTSYDTQAAWLAAVQAANPAWTMSAGIDSTSPQWTTEFRCDAAKECWEGYGKSDVVTLATPIPAWVACQQVSTLEIGGPRQNIGAPGNL